MKVSGSYERVTLGVSQQVPQDRREGQHNEQVNCLSDPVKGTMRRHGSVYEGSLVVGGYNAENAEAMIKDVANYRSYDFLVGSNRYTIVYRKQARPTGSQAPFCFVFNKETKEFVPVNIQAGNALVDALEEGGISAITNVGRYLYIAGNTVIPSYDVTDIVDSNDNRKHAVAWVKTGLYSKTYELVIVLRNTNTNIRYTLTASYKTMPAQYDEPLDTSDIILVGNDNYQKEINDRTNDYNSAVTEHIVLAAEDVLQANIAQKIIDAMEDQRDTAGLDATALDFELSNSTIGIIAGADYIIEDAKANDKGDREAFVSVSNSITDVARLTAEHYPGKVVRIKPKKSDESDSYYMRAVKREDASIVDGLQEVTWIQSAGDMVEINSAFAFGTIEDGQFYLAGSASGLETIADIDDVPDFTASEVGDTLTSPVPFFLENRIDYLGSFQDRLVVGSKSTLTFSRPGRYLSFFRTDVLSILDDDPIEIYPNGSEDDTITSSVQFQQNVLLFGDRKQYMLSGKVALTPKTAIITTVGAHEDSIDMEPTAAGNFVFYGKSRLGYTTIHQFQGGPIADTPESYDISAHVPKYMVGSPVESLTLTTPNTILVRTDKHSNGMYVYSYLDAPDGSQRLWDSWSKWEWDPQLGQIVGWSALRGDISIFTLRHGVDWDNVHRWFIVSDRFTLDTELSTLPYMDSMRKYNDYIGEPSNEWFTGNVQNVSVAFDNSVDEFLIGQPMDVVDAFTASYPDKLDSMWIGVEYNSWFSPTNPYVRDQQGKSIVEARTVINQFVVSASSTSGISFTVHTRDKPQGFLVKKYNGRQVGRLNAILGTQPVSTGPVQFSVGRQNDDFTYRINSIGWLPMGVTAITWVGQYFSRTKRMT